MQSLPLNAVKSVVPKGGLAFELATGYRTFSLVAESQADYDGWVAALDPSGRGPPAAPAPAAAASNSANPFGASTNPFESAPAPAAASSSANPFDGAKRSRALSRPGVLHEGMLSKSPPNLSLRRLKEEKRLQPRYFVLTKRSLTYYPDSSPHCAPLGTVPLGAIVLCEPKGGGKHAGKFYLHTVSREFSLVAPSADEMSEWVDAINAARARSTTRSGGARPSRTRARPPPRRRSRRRRRPRCRRSRRRRWWRGTARAAEGDGALAALGDGIARELAEAFEVALRARCRGGARDGRPLRRDPRRHPRRRRRRRAAAPRRVQLVFGFNTTSTSSPTSAATSSAQTSSARPTRCCSTAGSTATTPSSDAAASRSPALALLRRGRRRASARRVRARARRRGGKHGRGFRCSAAPRPLERAQPHVDARRCFSSDATARPSVLSTAWASLQPRRSPPSSRRCCRRSPPPSRPTTRASSTWPTAHAAPTMRGGGGTSSAERSIRRRRSSRLLRRLAAAAEPLPPAAADATAALRVELSSLQDGAASRIGARLLRSRDVAAQRHSPPSLAPSGSRAAAPCPAYRRRQRRRRPARRCARSRREAVSSRALPRLPPPLEYSGLLLTGTHRLPPPAAAVAGDDSLSCALGAPTRRRRLWAFRPTPRRRRRRTSRRAPSTTTTTTRPTRTRARSSCAH